MSDTPLLCPNYWDHPRNRLFGLLKVVIIAAIALLCVINGATGFIQQNDRTECITDAIFDLTAPLNNFFQEQVALRHAVLILSSACIDILVLHFAYRFLVHSKSWRSVLSALSFYITRGLLQMLFLMRIPPGYIWEYPGFPSLSVSYQPTTDFFFSGHVGFAFLCCLEYRLSHKYNWAKFALAATVFEASVMLSLRAHYFIDIVGGIVFAHYIWTVAGWLAPHIDAYIGPYRSPRSDFYRTSHKYQ
mmetsp:Transcript_6666/g.11790  ORF Transcript_6666/g.11790 Transcript_6666/m.11790 type:complete len:246 (+) Transcript_6666:2380-3117(+)